MTAINTLTTFVFCLSVLWNTTVYSQDTLQNAIELSYQKKFEEAISLIRDYSKLENNQKSLKWLATFYYWNGDIKNARTTFQKLYETSKDNCDCLLEYGKFLYEQGNIIQAERLLSEFTLKYPDHKEAKEMLFYIYTWQGEIQKARETLNRLADKYPEDPAIDEAKAYLHKLTQPLVEASRVFQTDDQPLAFRNYQLKANQYVNKYFHPEVTINQNQFRLDLEGNNTFLAQLKNSIQLNHLTTVRVSGGYFKNNNVNYNLFTYELSSEYKFYKDHFIQVGYQKLPYQYNIRSISNPFSENRLNFTYGRRSEHGLIHEITARTDHYLDGNKISHLYGWLLFPILKEDGVNFHAGYSLSFSTSQFSTYREEVNTAPVSFRGPRFLNREPAYSGYYDPYFTPKNQVRSLILTQLRLGNESNFFGIEYHFNAGSFTDAPVNIDNNDNVEFSKTQYKPMDLKLKLQFNIHKAFSLYAAYEYQRLYFYQTQLVDLGIILDFSKSND